MKNQAIGLFYQAEDYFFRSISKKCLDLEDQATGYCTGILSENFNLLIIKEKISGTIEHALTRATLFFEINQVPWSAVVAEEYLAETIEKNLGMAGLSCGETSVAMSLDIRTYQQLPCLYNLIIHPVNDNLDHWALPLLQAFESTPQITNQYRDAHHNALKEGKNFHHFSCYKDGIPVASLTLTVNGCMARIDDVGTLPAYQNKGIATSLIDYAIGETKRLGATHCFLEASASGFSVYQKIGFQPLFKKYIYGLLHSS